jgi:4-amino-4-deoxy-L-arabinose transferase-like glycosyltransferase
MPDAISETPSARIPSQAWVLLTLGAYFVLMTLQAALLAPSGRSDDTETLLLSQSLEWGYESKNPPAFYWLAWVATTVFGPSPAVIYGLRLAGVFAGFAGLYAIARRVQPDPLLAVGAGLGMLATLHFHWYLLNYLTNTSLAMALAPLAVLALLRLRERRGWSAFALLGAVLGLGVLTRYNFAIFAAGLVLAALATPAWRVRLLRPQALAAVGVAGLMLAPHVLWAAGHWEVLGEGLRNQVVGSTAPPYLARVLEGALNLAEASVSVLLAPLGLLAAVCFPRAFRRVAVADADRAADLALVGRLVVFCLGLMLVYVGLGTSYVKPHHLFFLAFAPLWLIGRLDPADLRQWAAPAFVGGIAACGGLAAIAYSFDTRADARTCEACEEYQPVETYAAALRTAGFAGGTILTLSRRQDFPAAALRRHFPAARIVAAGYPAYAPPPNPRPGACAIVWSGASDWPASWPDAPRGPVPGLGLPLPDDVLLGSVTGRLALSGRRTHGMRYALIPQGLGPCR